MSNTNQSKEEGSFSGGATSGRERSDQAFEANMRVDAVVDLASMLACEAFERRLDGPADDLVDQMLDKYEAHPSVKELREAVRDCEDELESLGEVLHHRNLLGLAVQFSTPVMERMGARSWAFSWGYTQSTWVYAETYEEAWKLGIAWAERCREEAKAAPKKKARRKAALSSQSEAR